jgi:hypothetical protein
MQPKTVSREQHLDRRYFIGGSDARVIISQDEKALIRLWQEKRGEVGPEGWSMSIMAQVSPRYRGAQPDQGRAHHWACHDRGEEAFDPLDRGDPR